RSAKRKVECGPLQPLRIVQQPHKRKFGAQPVDDPLRSITTSAIDDEDLKTITRERIIEQGAQAGLDVTFLVQRRKNDGDEGGSHHSCQYKGHWGPVNAQDGGSDPPFSFVQEKRCDTYEGHSLDRNKSAIRFIYAGETLDRLNDEL